MNSYGDGNTYRGKVCKDSETPTIITDGKTAYSGKDYPVHSSGPWSVTLKTTLLLNKKNSIVSTRSGITGATGGLMAAIEGAARIVADFGIVE